MITDDANTARSDGRARAQLRALSCARGVLARADGSARWAQGGTSVLAAVYGPVETTVSRQDSEKAAIEVVFRPRAGLVGPTERQSESMVRQAVQGVVVAALHPRTVIQVAVQVESDDGSVLACALNAAGAALVDAGVPVSSQLVAVGMACGVDGHLAMDPTAEEEEAAGAVGCFAYAAYALVAPLADDAAPGTVPVLMTHVRGSVHIDAVHDLLDAAVVAAERVAAFLRLSTERDFEMLTTPS